MLLLGGLLLSAFSISRPSRHSSRLVDAMTDIESIHPRSLPNLFWFESVSSTMDTVSCHFSTLLLCNMLYKLHIRHVT
ncbi:hypothetical protein EON65_55255 [archaeon]|nr:MAG: hypothetical protein EON65_55255 [archaeon]